MFILGMTGWSIFFLMAICCVANPKNHALAIVIAITGAGFGIMMQIANIAKLLIKIL